MPKLRVMALAATLAGLTVFPAAGQDTTADTVIATVNGTEITMGHMIVARAQLPQQYQQIEAALLFDSLLEQLIQQTVLSQTTEGSTRRVDLTLENQRRTLLAGEALEAVVAEAVTEEKLQAAYDAKYTGQNPELEYNAAHILVESIEDAQAIKAELDGGANFETLARERSTGPSGPNGGALGWFGPGMMVKPFEDAVRGLEPGQVSDPVETQFGWHIVRLNETRVQEAPTLEDVQAELASELQQTTVETHIETLVSSASITRAESGSFDPAALADLSLVAE